MRRASAIVNQYCESRLATNDVCVGSQGAGRRLNWRHVGFRRRSPWISHRVIPALWGLTLLLSIALAGTSSSDSLASSCSGWGSGDSEEFWRVACFEMIEECLTGAEFVEPGPGDASSPFDNSSEMRVLSVASTLDDRPMDPRILPAGTRLVIPRWVLREYEEVKHEWSQVRTYLFLNFFITAPSLFDERTETGLYALGTPER